MNNKKDSVLSIALAVVMILTLAACGQKQEGGTVAISGDSLNAGDAALRPDGEAGIIYENKGRKLLVPAEYNELLQIETPMDSPDGALFAVYDRASILAAQEQGYDVDGAGWLFDICAVDDAKLHEILCWDMSGTEVFAADNTGKYYLFNTPTDVRIFLEGDEAAAKQHTEKWEKLLDWTASVIGAFTLENGLDQFWRSNNTLDMYLARIAYAHETDYTVSSLEHGSMAPRITMDVTAYAEKLIGGNGVSYEEADLSETPDGEYIVLSIPAEDIRFDFFLAPGGENYVRTVWNGENEQLMRASFLNGNLTASGIMQAWYDALVTANGGAVSTDVLLGTWAEETAGRGVITFERGAGSGEYNVTIDWANGAAETYIWEMEAFGNGDGTLSYRNAKHFIRTFTTDTDYTDAVQYENGEGSFVLSGDNEMTWDDHTGHAGDECVFIHVG